MTNRGASHQRGRSCLSPSVAAQKSLRRLIQNVSSSKHFSLSCQRCQLKLNASNSEIMAHPPKKCNFKKQRTKKKMAETQRISPFRSSKCRMACRATDPFTFKRSLTTEGVMSLAFQRARLGGQATSLAWETYLYSSIDPHPTVMSSLYLAIPCQCFLDFKLCSSSPCFLAARKSLNMFFCFGEKMKLSIYVEIQHL